MNNKAFFLDRDGVINREIGKYITNLNEFRLNPGSLPAIQKIKEAGFKLIIITNQGGISKGLYSKEVLDCIHEMLTEHLTRLNIDVDEIYACPHHDKYEKCLCRKPGSLMVEKAVARFKLDKTKSFLIGDSERDIEAGERAGIKSYKIKSNQNIFPLVQRLLKSE